ncbi:hypothetical protein EMIT0P43_10327 [Pseudomonas jessenii]
MAPLGPVPFVNRIGTNRVTLQTNIR